jgi:hypothetical protein
MKSNLKTKDIYSSLCTSRNPYLYPFPYLSHKKRDGGGIEGRIDGGMEARIENFKTEFFKKKLEYESRAHMGTGVEAQNPVLLSLYPA